MTTTIPTPQQLLTRAADILDERGWFQGDYTDVNGCLCALGSVRLAAAEAADVDMDNEYYDYTCSQKLPQPVLLVLREAEKRLFWQSPYGDVVLWNDEDGRTKDEVQALLRRAAESGPE